VHADRTNRVLLLLLAVLMIAAGGGAFAASIGAYGTGTTHSTLMDNPAGRFFGAQGDWLWPVVAAAAAILALLAVRWLLALLFSSDRAGDLPIRPADSAGQTVLAARALTEAVAEEIESYQGVDSASARLIGEPADPKLVVSVDLEATTDIAALRSRIETGAITHARVALGNPALPAQLDLTVTTRRPARVT
jgi:hypothetical protein